MNINIVRDNLVRTISSKETMLELLCPSPCTRESLDEPTLIVKKATIEFLKTNISELNRILADVEQCIAQNELT